MLEVPRFRWLLALCVQSPSLAVASEPEFFIDKDRVISLKTELESLSLRIRFNVVTIRSALESYDVKYAGEIEGYDVITVSLGTEVHLEIHGSFQTGEIKYIGGYRSSIIDGAGARVGLSASRAFDGGYARCSIGMYTYCQSQYHTNVLYLISWAEDCKFDLVDFELTGVETKIEDCALIDGIEVWSDGPRPLDGSLLMNPPPQLPEAVRGQ